MPINPLPPRLSSFWSRSSVAVALLLALPATAHMDLVSPQARYGRNENKACPCGVGGTNRVCDIPISEQVDNNRSTDRVTTYQAGETITVTFDEYVGHSGRWRIAFDNNGAESIDFNSHILLDMPDPSGNTGNTNNGSIWSFDVTLPNIACDNCTLQLVQVMDGQTTVPATDPSNRSSYYQCADIILVAPDAGTPEVDAGTPEVDAGTPEVDAGTPEVDAGTPVVDAGTPEVDAGNPETDAGAEPPTDAGEAPADDAGNTPIPPPDDAGVVPVEDAGDPGDEVDAGGTGEEIVCAHTGVPLSSTTAGLLSLMALGVLGFRRRRSRA